MCRIGDEEYSEAKQYGYDLGRKEAIGNIKRAYEKYKDIEKEAIPNSMVLNIIDELLDAIKADLVRNNE